MHPSRFGPVRGHAEWREPAGEPGDEREGRGVYWGLGLVALLIACSLISAILSVANGSGMY